MTDLSKIPLVALSAKTNDVICTLLNPPKVIPTETGFPRDWRGFAHFSDLPGEILPSISSHSNPTGFILRHLEEKSKNYSFKNLWDALELIERWDILDDTEELFEKDAEVYLKQVENSQRSAEKLDNQVEDEKVLTTDDLYRTRDGLDNQCYDAFLLYADEDFEFAKEVIDNLENKYKLKLCLKDRDLIAGITFEHEAIMTLISERCNRLVAIVSPNFLKSPANKFFLNYAQAVGIDKRQRKIVPCMYERCQLPPQLSYMFILDYSRKGLYDFWGRLRDSIKVPPIVSSAEKSLDLAQDAAVEIPDDRVQVAEETRSENRVSQDETVLRSTDLDFKRLKNKSNKKKLNNILRWTKKKWNRKIDEKVDHEPITETVTIESLPSLDDLSSLSTRSISEDEKPAGTSISDSIKKMKLKKILLKS